MAGRFGLNEIELWGWGFAQFWRRCFFEFYFLRSGFHLPEKWKVQTGFRKDFCAQILAQIFAPIFAQIFGAQILRRFLRRFSADLSLTFWRLKKIGFPESRKDAQKICSVATALLGRVHHSISAFLSRQLVTQSPLGPHTQGEQHVSDSERPSWQLWAERHACICSK